MEIPFSVADDALDDHQAELTGRRVPLLSGNPRLARTAQTMLADLHMEMDWARDAAEAVNHINDAMFSDVDYLAFLTGEEIPGVDLMAFLPQVRQRIGGDFPILLLSETDWSQTEYMFTQAGVDGFIPLPLFRSRLAAELYACTQEGRARQRERLRQVQVLIADNTAILRQELFPVLDNIASASPEEIGHLEDFAAALGHHCYYDGSGGYPPEYDRSTQPDQPMIDLVSAAGVLIHAMDDMTVIHHQARSLDQALEMVRQASGTQLAPGAAGLLLELEPEIRAHLEADIQQAYEEVFRLLTQTGLRP